MGSVIGKTAQQVERRVSKWEEAGPLAGFLVGTAGFEPATSSSRTMRATKLRYVPNDQQCISPKTRRYLQQEPAPSSEHEREFFSLSHEVASRNVPLAAERDVGVSCGNSPASGSSPAKPGEQVFSLSHEGGVPQCCREAAERGRRRDPRPHGRPPQAAASPRPAPPQSRESENSSPSPTKWGKWPELCEASEGEPRDPPHGRPPQSGGQSPAAQLPRKAGRARKPWY